MGLVIGDLGFEGLVTRDLFRPAIELRENEADRERADQPPLTEAVEIVFPNVATAVADQCLRFELGMLAEGDDHTGYISRSAVPGAFGDVGRERDARFAHLKGQPKAFRRGKAMSRAPIMSGIR